MSKIKYLQIICCYAQKIDEMVNEILEVVESRGVIKDVTKNNDATVDIWVDDRLYKLFDFDWGVIEI